MVAYDPAVIRQFAESLYDRANSIVVMHTILGGVIGGAAGGLFKGTTAALIGAAVAAAVGCYLGIQKAFLLRLQAQTALCQVQVEENTRRALPQEAVPEKIEALSRPDQKELTAPPSGPLGKCPSCSATIPLAAGECPKCNALFGPHSAWKVEPL